MVQKILVLGGNGFIGANASSFSPLLLQLVYIRFRGMQSRSGSRFAGCKRQVRVLRSLGAIVHISQCTGSASGKPYQTAKGHRPDWTDNVCCLVSRYCATDRVFAARHSSNITNNACLHMLYYFRFDHTRLNGTKATHCNHRHSHTYFRK